MREEIICGRFEDVLIVRSTECQSMTDCLAIDEEKLEECTTTEYGKRKERKRLGHLALKSEKKGGGGGGWRHGGELAFNKAQREETRGSVYLEGPGKEEKM